MERDVSALHVLLAGNRANGATTSARPTRGLRSLRTATAYFISLSLTFAGDVTETGSAVGQQVDRRRRHLERPVTLVAQHRRLGRRAVLLQRQGVDHRRSVRLELRLRDLGPAPQAWQLRDSSAEHSFAFRGDTLFARTTDGGTDVGTGADDLRERPASPARSATRSPCCRTGLSSTSSTSSRARARTTPGYDTMVMRSTDHGATWSDPIEVAPDRSVGTSDPDTGARIRTGCFLPQIAVDLNPDSPGYGNLYAVWCDSFGSEKTNGKFAQHDGLHAVDGRRPDLVAANADRQIRRRGSVHAVPCGRERRHGRRDVLRLPQQHAGAGLPTDQWFVHCHPTAVDGPCELGREPRVRPVQPRERCDRRRYFLGDYEGMTAIGTNFASFFSAPTPTDPDNTYLATITPS